MEKKVFQYAVDKLGAATMRKLDRSTLAVYWERLKDLTNDDAFMDTINFLIDTHDGFPKIKTIRETYNDVLRRNRMSRNPMISYDRRGKRKVAIEALQEMRNILNTNN